MMEISKAKVPKFVWIVLLVLGCIDLLRGFVHTMMLEYAAINIAGLDLSYAATDQLRLLGTFGISNWLTGAVFILIALKAKEISIYVIGLIPLSYIVGIIGMRINLSPYADSQADWGGLALMIPYLGVCILTFSIGIIIMHRRQKSIEQ